MKSNSRGHRPKNLPSEIRTVLKLARKAGYLLSVETTGSGHLKIIGAPGGFVIASQSPSTARLDAVKRDLRRVGVQL